MYKTKLATLLTGALLFSACLGDTGEPLGDAEEIEKAYESNFASEMQEEDELWEQDELADGVSEVGDDEDAEIDIGELNQFPNFYVREVHGVILAWQRWAHRFEIKGTEGDRFTVTLNSTRAYWGGDWYKGKLSLRRQVQCGDFKCWKKIDQLKAWEGSLRSPGLVISDLPAGKYRAYYRITEIKLPLINNRVYDLGMRVDKQAPAAPDTGAP